MENSDISRIKSQMEKKTVLYITQHYFSTNTAAGIRADRFVNALIQRGYGVVVVTKGDNACIEEISPRLRICCISKENQVPAEIKKEVLPKWPWWKRLPGPDPEYGLSKAIFCVSHWLIRHFKIDALFATALPFGLMAIAHTLAGQYQLPMVLEFRDAWFTGMPWPYKSYLEKRRARLWESRCVRDAQAILAETETQRQILVGAYGESLGRKIFTVRHSYETAAEKGDGIPPKTSKPFTIAYTGQLRGIDIASATVFARVFLRISQWLRRGLFGACFCENLQLEWMSPHYLLQALAGAAHDDPEFGRTFQMHFVGNRFPEIDHWAKKLGISEQVIQHGPLPHSQVQEFLAGADLLVLSLYGIKYRDYHWCVPGKTYTYLGSGKTILALLPHGEARDLVLRAGTGFPARPDDIHGIQKTVLDLFRKIKFDEFQPKPNWDFIQQFHLPVQQNQFVQIISSVMRERESSGVL
jgi:hypothetical protein